MGGLARLLVAVTALLLCLVGTGAQPLAGQDDEARPLQPQLSRLQDLAQRPLALEQDTLARREKHRLSGGVAGSKHPRVQSQQQQQQQAQQSYNAHVPSIQPSSSKGSARGSQSVPLGAIAAMTLCMALASGLGAVPFFFVGQLSRPWAGLANAVASGVMLAASFGLIQEGTPYSGPYAVGGILLGALFIKISQQYLDRYEVESFEELRGAEARKVILFLAVMAAHAVGEGSGVGVSFSGQRGWAQGTSVTLAIGLHNVPEGLAVATVMAAKGASPSRALLWSVLTSLPQALVAVPSFLFVEAFRALLPLAMGFAAGCMIWIVFAELLPDALEALPGEQVATAATFAAAWLCALSVYIASLERPNGTLASPFAGQLPSLLPLALNLLPTCLIPGIAAGMAANVMPSRPAALGLSSGVLVALGAASTVQLLLLSGQGVLWTLVLVPAGWVAGLAIWQHLDAVMEGVAAGDSHKKHDEQVDAEKGAAAEQWQQQQQQYHHQHKQQQQHDGPLSGIVHATSYAISHHRTANGHFNGGPLVLPVALQMHAGGRNSMARLAIMGLIAVLANAVPHGMVLARAAVVQADEPSHLLLPSLIIGTVLALGSVGVLVATLGGCMRRIALCAAALSATGPVLSLMLLLIGGAPDTAQATVVVEGLSGKAQALAAGLAMCTGLVFKWPVAKRLHARRALLGFAVGTLLVVIGGVLMAGLCVAMPYCLRLHRQTA